MPRTRYDTKPIKCPVEMPSRQVCPHLAPTQRKTDVSRALPLVSRLEPRGRSTCTQRNLIP
jgi:hypothetical protein